MTYINDIFDGLFGRKNSGLTHKENFTQSLDDQEKVKNWLASAEGGMYMAQILKGYQLQKAGLQENPELHILNSPYANGFAITYNPSITEKNFSNLFFAFGLRMLDLGYYRVSLDRTIKEVGDVVKTTEKQYFKPSAPAIDMKKADQLYGNISIEKDLINNEPNLLKVLATVYSDHQYHDAQPFDQFMEELFKA